jgi:mannose-6-phosphate isomerase
LRRHCHCSCIQYVLPDPWKNTWETQASADGSQNKTLAADLHARDPEKFTDPNHKPEIALALGDFEAFVGWKPLADIDALLKLEPLQQFLPAARKREFDDQMLKGVCQNMLKAEPQTVANVGEKLKGLPKEAFGKDGYIPDLLPRLWDQYDKTVRLALQTTLYKVN